MQLQSLVKLNLLTALLTKGIRPRRCAMNSSQSTVVLFSISTRSMAIVGISARKILRRLFAMLRSVL